MIRSLIPSLALGALISAGCAPAPGIAVNPQGDFATIDTKGSTAAVSAIEKGDERMIAAVCKRPGAYQPPVLYALSKQLFAEDKRDDALYWFYLGQLRARSDANKALDPSATSAVSALNEKYGPAINRYAFQNVPKLKSAVSRAISTDASEGRSYDPRWIALHGMDAFSQSKVRFKPRSDWTAIDRTTRKEYEMDFKQALSAVE